MAAAQTTDVATRFLDALAHRDFGALGETFVDDAHLRALVPSALREAEGRDEIEERFRIWNGSLENFEVLDSEVSCMQDVVRIRWRVRGIDPDGGDSVYEQTAYASVAGGAIAAMNLVCTGRRPVDE